MTLNISAIAVQKINLDRLVVSDENVRKSDDDLSSLCASINAHGLFNPLIVKPIDDIGPGWFQVIAGGRRLMALKKLAADGNINKDYQVPCQVRDDDANGGEISLAENLIRAPMHPADEFDAFNDLVNKGMPEIDIAARFGVTETIVRQRLKLANVAPDIIAAYREGKITLASVMAFAISDDQDRQLEVYKSLAEQRDEDDGDLSTRTIRRLLTEEKVAGDDRRVAFVTLDRYIESGGGITRDLFAEDEDDVYLDNPDLLNKLVEQQLANEIESIKAQGWSWVIAAPLGVYAYINENNLLRERPERILSQDAQARINALNAEEEKIGTLCEQEDRMATDEEESRLEAIREEIEKIETDAESWPQPVKECGGAVIGIDHNGALDVEYGLIRRADKKALEQAHKKYEYKESNLEQSGTRPTSREEGVDEGSSEEDAPAEEIVQIPNSLRQDMIAYKTMAIQSALADDNDIALRVLIHALALKRFFDAASALHITVTPPSIPGVIKNGEHKAALELRKGEEAWRDKLPRDPNAVWAWVLDQKKPVLSNLLSFLIAPGISCASAKEEADDIAYALKLDMSDYFVPDVDNYFGRIGKLTIMGHITEVFTRHDKEVPKGWGTLKKDELAKLAVSEIRKLEKDWLPADLRIEKVEEPAAANDDAEESDDEQEAA